MRDDTMAPIAHADLATVAAELRAWMKTVAADTALDLVVDAERIAAEMGLAHHERRRLIADRAAAYTSRLNGLVALHGPRGTA